MEEYEEDDDFFDDELASGVGLDEEDDEDDPKDNAFMRGVEEAVQIKDAEEEEEV